MRRHANGTECCVLALLFPWRLYPRPPSARGSPIRSPAALPMRHATPRLAGWFRPPRAGVIARSLQCQRIGMRSRVRPLSRRAPALPVSDSSMTFVTTLRLRQPIGQRYQRTVALVCLRAFVERCSTESRQRARRWRCLPRASADGASDRTIGRGPGVPPASSRHRQQSAVTSNQDQHGRKTPVRSRRDPRGGTSCRGSARWLEVTGRSRAPRLQLR
jgi:hypothetical protein